MLVTYIIVYSTTRDVVLIKTITIEHEFWLEQYLSSRQVITDCVDLSILDMQIYIKCETACGQLSFFLIKYLLSP